MDYIPNTKNEKKDMLREIGINDTMDLFGDIDKQLILKKPLKIGENLKYIPKNLHCKILSGF